MMSGVNAYAIAFMGQGPDHIAIKGQNRDGHPVDSNTLFEGASLSKTVFAYLFWKMRAEYPKLRGQVEFKDCRNQPVKIDPLLLLRHSIASTDSCLIDLKSDSFKYSENNYLLLQKALEDISGKSLEELARHYVFTPLGMHRSSFIWHYTDSNYVDGFYEGHKLHRALRRFGQAQSNGTLFTCLADMKRFAWALLNSTVLDSVLLNETKVHDYKHLSWGNGMGIDRSTGSVLFWQWGCNWSYNHILIINKKEHRIGIGLSNSILGAKRLKDCFNYLYSNNLELFNYINWY